MSNDLLSMTEFERQQYYQQNIFVQNQNVYTRPIPPVNIDDSNITVHQQQTQQQKQRSRLKKSYSECENVEILNSTSKLCDNKQTVNNNFISPSKRKKKQNFNLFNKSDIHNTPINRQLLMNTPIKQTSSIGDEYQKYQISRGLNKSSLNIDQMNKIPQYKYEQNQHHQQQQQQQSTSGHSDAATVTFSDKICQIPLTENYDNRNYYAPDPVKVIDSNKLFVQDSTENYLGRGSLRRGLGRSTLSLCSCDADTEMVVPDPMRPLYQYSLDRKKPLHTYTCEQNAQILLRIERDKQQKKYNSSGKLNTNKETNDCPSGQRQDYSSYNTDVDIAEDELTDADFIPPPPPPLRRNHSFTYHCPTRIAINDCTSNPLNCTTTPPGFINSNESRTSKPDLCEFTKIEDENKKYSYSKMQEPQTPEISIVPNGYCPKQYQQYMVDDSYMQQNNKENNSFFLYHQEPPQYVPNYDSQQNHQGKFNTIGPTNGRTKQNSSKFHTSNCNLNQYDSSNLLNGRYFSNSLTNFNFNHTHTHTHYNKPYTQYHGVSVSGSKTIMGDSYNSMTSIGTPKQQIQQQKGMPWRHRQCPSGGSSSSGTSSTRWDLPSRHWLAVTSILLIAGAAGVAVPLALRVTAGAPLEERLQAATQLLDTVPLIDGHNDLPWNIRKFLHNQLNDFHFDDDLRNVMPWAKSPWSHTDLVRLRKGRISAQFWAAYVPCEAQHKDAVQLTLEQIDVIKRLTDRYSPHLTTCTSVADILQAHKNNQLCSLTGVEGGHSLGGSLGVLRTLYTIGVRYVTLTSTCHTPWADSSHADAPKFDVKHGGLTTFGKTIIREMNRLGMIVDLSHVSVGTMRDALSISEAPVIFSHSSAYELCNSSRNVQDDILELIARNRGIVMVNFYSRFLSCSDNATVQDAVAHINHIKRVAGIDHVGIGAGYDGINFTPKGLEDVSTYPMLFAELLGDGWTVDELTKLAGQNFIRVMEEVEKVRDTQKQAGIKPFEDIPTFRDELYNCTTS